MHSRVISCSAEPRSYDKANPKSKGALVSSQGADYSTISI